MPWSNSNYSNIASVTTLPAPVTPLPAPTNLVATAVTPAQTDTTAKVQLNWTSNSGGNESGFGVERSTSSTGPFTQITTTAKSVTAYTDTGLNFSTIYYYRVRALA